MTNRRKPAGTFVRVRAYWALCALLLFGLIPLRAEAKNGDIIDNTNGLVSANVNDVCQTADGFLWIAQYEGLTRYDGQYYQLINSVDIGDEEIRLEQITNVESDADNCLYIGTKDYGMIVYRDGVYSAVSQNRGRNVTDLCVCGDKVCVATTEGAYIYTHDGLQWLEDTMESPIVSITADDMAVYYVAQDNAVYRYDGQTVLLYNDKPIKIVRAYADGLYCGSRYGTLVHVDGKSITEYSVDKDDPINTLCMQQGVLVIGTDKGVFMRNGDRVERIKELGRYSGINHIIFDYEGGMWMATGVGLVELHRFGIKNMFLSYNLPESPTNACFRYDDRLYIGTNDGVAIIDEANDCTVSNALTQRLQGIRVRDFAEMNGDLFVATYSAKEFDVVVFDGKSIHNITAEEMLGSADADGLDAHGQIRCFARCGEGLLIGTNYGITLLKNGRYTTVKMEYRPLSMTVGQNEIYVCTDGDGIYTLDFALNITGRIVGTQGKTILRAVEFEDGLLYTAGTALCFQKDGVEKSIRTQNIGSIVDLVEMREQMAILTGSGMLVVDKSTLLDEEVRVIKKLTSANGVESGVTANGRVCYLPQSSTLYLNCQSGVYKYSESETVGDAAVPRLAVNAVIVDNVPQTPQDILQIGSHANRVEIDLSVLTFLDRDDLTIHYRMIGVDDTMQVQNFNRKSSVEYMNLKGGRYTLCMYAENGNGVRSDEVKIIINKEIRWIERAENQLLAILVCVVLGAGLTMLVFRGRMYRERRRAAWSKRIAEESLEAVAGAIDAKDNDTNGHSLRVAKLAECIGRRLDLSADELEFLYYTGLMHDVGKIGIPDHILNKPGRLSEEEYAYMKRHPEIGSTILKPIHSIPHLEDGVLYHHERYDGGGYPNHLKGDEIPLTGKIIACADVYDALASRRCYKAGMSDTEIIVEFERGKGTHFDPEVAQVAIECIKSGEFNAILMRWQPETGHAQTAPKEE